MKNIENKNNINELMVNAIIKALKRANIPVVKAADDLAEILQMAGEQVEFRKKRRALETASGSRKNHQPTAISSADGAKIIKNIEKLIKDYKEKSSQSKTFNPPSNLTTRKHRLIFN